MAVTRLDLNYDAQVAAVRSKVMSYAYRRWSALSAYRDADAERLIAEIVPRVEAGQKRVAELTDAYLSRVAAEQLGTAITRGAVVDASTEALRGVDAATVYQRPFTTLYTGLRDGDSLTTAASKGGERLLDLVSSGLQLAKTHSARKAMSRTGVELYQRTLTGREDCALCVIASTQRYHKSKLMPIHPGCDCGIKSFIGDPDEQVIAPELLEQTHAAVEAKAGRADSGGRDVGLGSPISDYLNVIVTHEHGELGPVLAWRKDHFTGPSEV
ncbi:hypothetical protein P5G50_18375 [Leifsonia sp. F6_8S_P_1B]|uniref:Phage Mu protein F like protein n=1 Tax=Leifsonia williamsii TaxID=3035919 RepID=A0ABT8KG28_9MICO|nr:hypothetical protein [Leifsonia williamsii]MDN4616418.1 hypothetical protein [Leifsonia williamsii]